MRKSFILLSAALFSFCFATHLPGAETGEAQAIAVLKSQATLAEKDAACEKLKLLGTSGSVAALSDLLSNPDLSHSARYALESMPLPEAGLALVTALPKTSGLIQVGIIGSLGARGEARAVPELLKLLDSSDPQVSIAAARALGQIGQPSCIGSLQSCENRTHSGPVHEAVVDALLRCANRLASAGKTSRALGIYEHLYKSEKMESVQVAAFRGMIRTSGSHGAKLITRAILNEASAAQTASLQCARETPGTELTLELARMLPRLDEPRQIAVLKLLAQRNDAAAVSSVLALASPATEPVRIEVLRTLGQIGDASAVPLLSECAASGTPPEKAAARQALVDLRRGNVAETLVSQLATASGEVQAELARALGERGDKSAVPRLYYLAEKGPESAQKSALKALGLLIDESQVPALVNFVVTTPSSQGRSEGAEALNYACQRIIARHAKMNVEPLVKGIVLGKKEARIALLPVCSPLINPEVRLAIRAGVEDPDPEVHAVGVRTLCDTIDPDLLEDLLSLARTTKEENFRNLAIAAGVRLVTQEEHVKISRGQRVVALKSLLASCKSPEQKRLVLAGLGEMPDVDALRAVEPLLEDETLHTEASRAAVKIAVALPGTYAKDSMAMLQKGLATASDDGTRQALEAAIKQLQDSIDYISDWMVAGPYRQNGKDYAALFDVVFPPETETAKGVDWKPLPAGADPKRPYVMDLFKLYGCQQCVAYARTWIQVEKEQPIRLELGSDDGVKVWLNDKQVYAMNTARPLTPGSDKVDLKLNAGWNMLLLKVTQNNLGWEFCARLVNPDGSHCDNLKIEAAPKPSSAANN